jgi:pimeloyl-ACP methyl ester carboxylesterase
MATDPDGHTRRTDAMITRSTSRSVDGRSSTKFERRLRSAALLLGAIGVSVAVGRHVHRRYESDMRRAYAAIEESATETVETSIGTVQYCTRGGGTPVLVSHGIVGGFDQAIRTGESLLETDAQLIGISRFGYLGSELPEEATPENQARAYVEVLDDLGIDDVVVIGTSAGGAPAVRFALDYPGRTRGLVLIGSTAPTERPLVGPTGPPHAILQDPVFWLLVTHAPRAFHALFGIDRGDYRSASPEARRRVDALLDTLVPVEPRKPGIRNDERVTNTAMVEHHDEYVLETLSVPTLAIHAEDDPLASFEDVERMVERIPDAEFLAYGTGGHLVFGHGDEIRRAVSDFVLST